MSGRPLEERVAEEEEEEAGLESQGKEAGVERSPPATSA